MSALNFGGCGWAGGAISMLLALAGCAGPCHAGTPIRAAAYVAELQTERLYRIAFRWDGAATLEVDSPQLIATAQAGGGVHFADDLVYVTGAGSVTRVVLGSGTTSTVSTFNNANACSADSGRAFLYCGWHFGLSRVPLQPLANGTLVPLMGADTNLTNIVFTPAHGIFYSTGTEAIIGDFGSLDLGSGNTVRLQTNAFATGITWDRFSARILLANLGRARLIDPANPSAIESQRDDSATQNYLSLNPSVRGHAIGTLCCTTEARLVLLDYSSSGSLSDPSTLLASATLSGLSQLSGEAAFDRDRLFAGGYEDGEF